MRSSNAPAEAVGMPARASCLIFAALPVELNAHTFDLGPNEFDIRHGAPRA